MRRIFWALMLAAAVLLSACRKVKVLDSGNRLRYCEAVYPMGDTLLITNFGTETPDPLDTTASSGYILGYNGNEFFTVVAADGTMSAPKGMTHSGNWLYVADVQCVHAINLKTGGRHTIALDTDEVFANHMVVIGDMLLLSVTNTGHILALDLAADGSPADPQFQLLTTVPGANGMLYHGGALYIASCNPSDEAGEENVIYIIDDFTLPMARPFTSRTGQYYGLATKSGWLYFSDRNGGTIGRIPLSEPDNVEILDLQLETPLSGPAGIAFFHERLYISDLPNSRILSIKE